MPSLLQTSLIELVFGEIRDKYAIFIWVQLNKPAAQAAAQAPAQTLPDATPPVGKICPFRKIAILLNQYSNLDLDVNIVCFMSENTIFTVGARRRCKDILTQPAN